MSGRTIPLRILAVSLACIAHAPVHAEPFAYVANLGSDNVTVIDSATGSVVATIAVGDEPDAIAVSPDGRRVYVSNFASHDVSVIDAASQRVTATVEVGRGPVGLVVSNDGNEVLVTNREDDTVSVIRTSSNRVTHTIPVGAGPDAVAITADGARAYVTNSSSTDPGVVSVINASYDREIDRIEVLRNPNRIAPAPDGTVYVTNYRAWNVTLIDPDNRAVADTFRVYRKPSGIAANPNGAFVYVVGKHGGVTVYDTALRAVSNWIDVPGRADGIAVARTGATGYVTNFDHDTVTAIDLTTDTVTATIAVGDQPFAVAVNCVGRGCTDRPFTPIPTPTHTPYRVPTSTPTATLPAPVTPVVLSVNRVSGRPGDLVALTVTLHANGLSVAGTQSDLHVAPELIDRSSIRCRVNPAIDKDSTAFAVHERPGDLLLRGLVISLENSSLIPDGSLLYTCNVRLAADAPQGSFVVAVDNVGAATPNGGALPTIATAGRIDVLSGTTTRALSSVDEFIRAAMCSVGRDAGLACARYPSCILCVRPQGVCDGGADDGLLCDCPDGRCVRSPEGGLCVGGRSDGKTCEYDTNCAGNAACVATHQLCTIGAARGMPCLNDTHCLDGTCTAARAFCAGGDLAGYGCIADGDCPRGSCSSIDVRPVPNTTAGPTATPESGRDGSDGCAITPRGESNAWLLAIGLFTALLTRNVSPAQRARALPNN